ncbi:preprotein translocase subunit SecE [Candidatus Curtissbacteria bacterium RIFCSPHIGHO2_12_FULL_41_17]|uniref:Protein translocase subunit SecE n=1 Tax=Candidatus Curtissbacteria bacterium RIFCSPHIGHO2_12_FULL_41_17 TaxID=1797722 RepID=A0A1F5HKN7_9BACT|nr:MAG: preprotein translocase subunit SecE [Candidatus Curtissbacteria bacterium RIFCSPHIGHO2_12_FULL_41_17]
MPFNPLTYLKESKSELGKVIWPTRVQTIKLTIMVIVVSIIVGSYITGLDAIFAKIAERFIR